MYLPLIYLDVRKKLSEWMKEFFPPSLATILNSNLPIWSIIKLFRIKQPQPLKVTPILLNLNKWYHHWPFLSKSAQNTKWCVTPVKKKNMRHLYLNDDSNKDKNVNKIFLFGLNVGVFLKTTKGTFW